MLKKIIEVKVMISMTKTNLALCCFYIILDLTQGLPYLETGTISWIEQRDYSSFFRTKAAFSNLANAEGQRLKNIWLWLKQCRRGQDRQHLGLT